MNVIYRFSSGSYSFTGNTTAFLEMEDGVNEKGLAIGLTSVYPPTVKPGMNAGLLLRFFLEKCKNTKEVIGWAQKLPISSAQTFTVADACGDIAVLECYADKLQISRPTKEQPYVCATNLFHSPELSPGDNTVLNRFIITCCISDWNKKRFVSYWLTFSIGNKHEIH